MRPGGVPLVGDPGPTVIKFGGSCLSGAEGFRRVGGIIGEITEDKVVVLSAVKGATDLLRSYLQERSRHKISEFEGMHEAISGDLFGPPEVCPGPWDGLRAEIATVKDLLYHDDEAVPQWACEKVITCGERLSVIIMGAYLKGIGIPAVPMTSDEAGIAAVGDYGSAVADIEMTRRNARDRLIPYIREGRIPIVTGFYGHLPDGSVATFGRNGSDYSAAVLANAIKAKELVLYKDVAGFMSADPALVRDATILGEITYEEGAELSHFGARILHPGTFGPIDGTGITIRIVALDGGVTAGTRIVGNRSGSGGVGVAYKRGVSSLKISINGSGNIPETLCRAYGILSERGLEPISAVTSQTSIGLVLPSSECLRALDALEAAGLSGMDRIRSEDHLALIGLVGERIEGDPGLLGRCLLSLVEGGIVMRMSGSGGTRSAYYMIVPDESVEKAVRSLHSTVYGS